MSFKPLKLLYLILLQLLYSHQGNFETTVQILTMLKKPQIYKDLLDFMRAKFALDKSFCVGRLYFENYQNSKLIILFEISINKWLWKELSVAIISMHAR